MSEPMSAPVDPVAELVGALTARRLYRRMSQAEIAAACAVSQATISRVEDGKADPPLRLLLNYAFVVGLELTWMLRAGARSDHH